MNAALETRDLAIGYRRRGKSNLGLGQGISLQLKPGQLVGLLGANGLGKSTLLRTLAGIQPPLAGQVLLAGCNLGHLKPAELARRLSMVLTNTPPPALMSGYGLVALGRQPHTDWLGRLHAQDHQRIQAALRAVKAEELAEMPVSELSDGQRQKLFIARALAQECPVMLLDEPTAFLDLPRRIACMALLKQLTREQSRAILVATHDLDLALRHCDRLWLMSASGMRVGAPQDLVMDGSLGAAFDVEGSSFEAHLEGAMRELRESPAIGFRDRWLLSLADAR